MNRPLMHLYRLGIAGLLTLSPALTGAQETVSKRALPQMSLDLNSLSYPGGPLRAGLQGRVLFAFNISGRGRVENIQIVDAEPAGEFDSAATRAMRQVQFTVPKDWQDSGGESQRFQFSVLFKLNPCVAPACVAPKPHEGADDFVVIGAQAR